MDRGVFDSLTDAAKTDATNPTHLSLADKLHNEAQLLASIPRTIGGGIVDSARDAWEHSARSTFEITSGIAIGAAFTLLSKNPRPLVAAAMTWTGRAFVGIAGVDLGSRFARPMADVWVNPDNLSADKKTLGSNLGDAVFNYALAVGGGIAGARLGEQYLATTKVGTFLQGFKETEISAEQLSRSLGQPENHATGMMARAFVRSEKGLDAVSALDGPIRMRAMPNGIHVGSSRDGSIIVTTADGTAISFKNERSFFGLRNNLKLAEVLHPGGDSDPVSSFADLGASATHFIGRDPAAYFDATPLKLTTDLEGSPAAIEAGGAHLYTGNKGGWHVNLGANTPADFAPISKESGRQGSFSSLKNMLAELKQYGVEPGQLHLNVFSDRFNALKKGAEAGLSQGMIERAGDIGSSIFEHQVLVHGDKQPDTLE